uniref:PDZ domain-containing protein n=1 Tax=Plectus sambesii TaxID=2011161 RepID=A0A914X4J8_9BILA
MARRGCARTTCVPPFDLFAVTDACRPLNTDDPLNVAAMFGREQFRAQQRCGPPPPPKPKHRLEYANNGGTQLQQLHNRNVAGIRDSCSDTDSGICADSDTAVALPSPQRLLPSALASTKRCTNEFNKTALNANVPPLPLRLAGKPSSLASTLTLSDRDSLSSARTTKSLRVRFADQSKSSPPPLPNYSYYFQTDDDQPQDDHYTVEDVESLPEPPRAPPSYDIACDRIRRLQLTSYEQRNSRRDQHESAASYSSRSASLPRRPIAAYTQTLRQRSAGFFSHRPDDYVSMGVLPARSMENLAMQRTEFTGPRPIRLPSAPIGSVDDLFEPARRTESSQRSRRSRSAGRPRPPPSRETVDEIIATTAYQHHAGRSAQPMPSFYSSERDYAAQNGRQVLSRLVALDHRGYRTVEIEKLEPGPFGFYIATGVLNRRKGIYVSRVSLTCLAPLLAVGDEILYVDGEPIKGRSLEYVQNMIRCKQRVILTILPCCDGR